MTTLEIDSGTGPRRVDLAAYLDPAAEERAHEDEYAWIKAVRHLRVDGEPFRARFTFRGDSLWWFAELYLHKEHAALNVSSFTWSAPMVARGKAAEQKMKAAEGKVREALAAAADSLPSAQQPQGLLK